jgi:hypothetical protein
MGLLRNIMLLLVGALCTISFVQAAVPRAEFQVRGPYNTIFSSGVGYDERAKIRYLCRINYRDSIIPTYIPTWGVEVTTWGLRWGWNQSVASPVAPAHQSSDACVGWWSPPELFRMSPEQASRAEEVLEG